MELKTENGIQYLSYINDDKITAGFSTRVGGNCYGAISGLDLGLFTESPESAIQQNRQLFFSTVANGLQIANLKQTHSTDIWLVDKLEDIPKEGDGLITQKKNILLCVAAADCGSVVFHDTDFSVVAAVHCGWKGTRDGIIENMLDKLSALADLKNITAYIGPMIHSANYEVGPEFAEFFEPQCLIPHKGKYLLDLPQCIYDKLTSGGLGSVIPSPYDTFGRTDLFYSYRNEGTTGRMLAFVGLK